MAEVILDASALLALLHDEPGAQTVARHVPGACVSAVNLAEVVGKLAEAGMPGGEIRQVLNVLGLNIVQADEDLAFRAGLLRPPTRSLGLSLGDRFCLALGQRDGARILTSDQAWSRVAGVDVEVVR